jgi:hypothetical protein
MANRWAQWFGAVRQPGPGDGQVCGHRRRTGRLQVVDQLRQQQTGSFEPVAQRPAHPQVVGDVAM